MDYLRLEMNAAPFGTMISETVAPIHKNMDEIYFHNLGGVDKIFLSKLFTTKTFS